MGRTVRRLAYPATVLVLLVGILVVGGYLATVALPDVLRTSSVPVPSAGTGSGGAATAGSPAPSASATSAMALSPIGIAIPPGTDCSACHTSTAGGVGTKTPPYLGHPLQGFANCTACHNPTGLVKTAPGHSSLHANDCLICHQENPNLTSMSQAPMRPEHMSGEACTDCHGVDKHAPLPSDMAGRGDNCWICHNGPEFQYLFSSASPSPSPIPPTGYQLEPPPSTAP